MMEELSKAADENIPVDLKVRRLKIVVPNFSQILSSQLEEFIIVILRVSQATFGKFSMDNITTCAFGVKPSSFAGGEFVQNAKNVFRRCPADGIKFASLMIPGMKQVIL